MSKALQASLSPQSRKLVMEMVLINKDMFINTPNYMLPPKLALAQQEMLASMIRSLAELA